LLTALFNCGPSDNSCYLGHTKNPDDDDDDDDDDAVLFITIFNVFFTHTALYVYVSSNPTDNMGSVS